jgi:hypothetical protein
VRRVRSNGEIKWRGRSIFISGVLVGEPVGLAEAEDGQWVLSFGQIKLGFIDHKGRLHKPRLWT